MATQNVVSIQAPQVREQLEAWTKLQLVEVTRKLHGSVGDTGKNDKAHYVGLLTDQYPDMAVKTAAAMYPLDDKGAAVDPARMMQEAIRLMAAGAGVNVDQVNALIDVRIADITARIEPRIEKIVVSGAKEIKVEGVAHAALEQVLQYVGLRQHLLLTGPSGCGKTFLAEQAAKALGLRFGSLSCSLGMSESQLIGRLLPLGDGGKYVFCTTQFLDCYENGGVFLLDEGDGGDANVFLVLNQALANGGFFLPHRVDNPYAKRHADFVCIMATNTMGHGGDGMYIRERLDGATLDRFRHAVLFMDYDPQLEEQLVHPDVLAWGRELRQRIASLKLRHFVSTRVLVAFSSQLANLNFGREVWERSFFADWSRDEIAKVGR